MVVQCSHIVLMGKMSLFSLTGAGSHSSFSTMVTLGTKVSVGQESVCWPWWGGHKQKSNCTFLTVWTDRQTVNCLINLVYVRISLPDVIFTMHFNIGQSRTGSQATWLSHLCRTLTLNTARYGFHWTFYYCVKLPCLIILVICFNLTAWSVSI